ncbi:MAG: ATP synthase F1 subunit delta [Bacteroidota bacterium]
MKNVRVARRYAMGFMASAEETKSVDRAAKDLELIGQILRDSREFRALIASPIVSPEKKRTVFRELLGPHIAKETLEFVFLMTHKNREALLADVVEQFAALRDELMGIVTADVKSAVEIAPPQEKDLIARLEQYTKKKVRVRFSLDKAMKGGLIVRIGDTVLDASLTRQLELLRKRLVEGSPLVN